MGLLFGSGSTKPTFPYDHWYGIQGDLLSNDYKLTRVGNLDLHRSLPIQKKLRRYVENLDGSVKYYLHQNDSRLRESGSNAIVDTTDGNVMLEKPEYYFRMEIQGTKWIRAYSEYPLPGFIKMERKAISPWYGTFDNITNTAVSGCFLLWDGNNIKRNVDGIVELTANAPQFRGGSNDAAKDGTYNSQLGVARTSVSKKTVRSNCKNGTHHGAYRAYNEIAWLQRCEYASLHCQDTYNDTLTTDGFKQGGLGSGPAVAGADWSAWGGYNPFIPNGVTATLGNNTGKVDYTIKNFNGADKIVQVTSYRGLENPFEYLWSLADDVLIHHSSITDKNLSVAYVCEDPTKFTSHSDSATTVPDGYLPIANIPKSDGYILQLTHSDKGYSFPKTLGGSSNVGACDYYYQPGNTVTGWFGALLGAVAHSGAGAGFGFLNTYYRSSYSNAYVGFRLCRF
ncbi:MAG: hypothetical protein PHG06_19075 [Parabacteroides sp.]|nr:hypothetical protein [Parabacteroides sp.]